MRIEVVKPAGKSRLKRLFERQFPGVLKIAPAEKLAGGGGHSREKEKEDGGAGDSEVEPSSLCLAKMVQNFMEEANEKAPRCGRRRCNCFNGNCDDSSDDDEELDRVCDQAAAIAFDGAEILKFLVPCASVAERNLLEDSSRILEKSKTAKGRHDLRTIVVGELRALGYDASICRCRWERTLSIPAGEHEYIDVVAKGGNRLLVEIDFRSEFEIARSTKAYRAALQSVPLVFVGGADRLRQIVVVVSEATRVSLKKKGLHFPPWRKPEYMTSKWLAPFERTTEPKAPELLKTSPESISETTTVPETAASTDEENRVIVVSPWQPPALKTKTSPARAKVVVAGLAAVLAEAI